MINSWCRAKKQCSSQEQSHKNKLADELVVWSNETAPGCTHICFFGEGMDSAFPRASVTYSYTKYSPLFRSAVMFRCIFVYML